MKILSYQIRLLEPLLVTAIDGDPNNAVSFDFLPGSVLRGAVISSWLRHHKKRELDLTDSQIKRLFFSNQVRYLNGYLAEGNARRLPVPNSWVQDKKAQREQDYPQTVDWAVTPQTDDDKQWKGISGFWAKNQGLKTLDRQLSIHLRRNRILGRSRKGEAGIYRYDALAAYQSFVALILCDRDDDAVSIENWLTNAEIAIGSSRNSGYGRVKIENVQSIDKWREVDQEIQTDVSDADEDVWIVSLLSDLLVRNKYGQFCVELDAIKALLQQALGISIEIDKNRTFLASHLLGGFNRKWGLNLPQLQAVKMGSVIVFSALDLDVDVIEKLEWEGIGEKREDGFGRIAINWQQADKVNMTPSLKLPPKSIELVDDDSRDLAQRMAERMLRPQLETALIKEANQLEKSIHKPTSSQLSRLRMVVLDALTQEPTEGRKRLQDYFNNIKARPKIFKQFSDDLIDGKLLFEWLETTSQSSKLALTIGKPIKIGNVSAEPTGKQIYHYNLRLVESVLHLAAKRLQKDGKR